MKHRPLVFLSIALLLGAIVWWYEQEGMLSLGDASPKPFFPNFNADLVGRVEYEHLIGGVQLRRSDNGWEVATFVTALQRELAAKEGKVVFETPAWSQADRGKVGQVLGVFGGLSRGILVSSNPEKQMLYQVNHVGQHLRLFDREGKKILELVIGKNGPDFASNYVRREGENDVYLVDRPLTGIFSVAVEDWKAKEPSAPASSDEAVSKGDTNATQKK